MIDTRNDFEKRKKEIEEYLEFVAILSDDENTRLKYQKNGHIINEKISYQLQKILIANGFLLLYNLIEATIRKSISEIYSQVKDDNVAFEQLSENLKKLWIKQKTPINDKTGNFNQDNLHKKIFDIAKEVLRRETIAFSTKKLHFPSTLDADEIRKLASIYGFDGPLNGRNLVTIKNKRNHLAHGEATFADIGRDYSIGELIDFKKETFEFLADVIDKIEDFINQKKYTVIPTN